MNGNTTDGEGFEIFPFGDQLLVFQTDEYFDATTMEVCGHDLNPRIALA